MATRNQLNPPPLRKITDFKKDAKYAQVYPIKMSEAKATVNELGVVTPYAGADKDDPAPFCVFLEKKYVDK
jgi:hypothetical protein